MKRVSLVFFFFLLAVSVFADPGDLLEYRSHRSVNNLYFYRDSDEWNKYWAEPGNIFNLYEYIWITFNAEYECFIINVCDDYYYEINIRELFEQSGYNDGEWEEYYRYRSGGDWDNLGVWQNFRDWLYESIGNGLSNRGKDYEWSNMISEIIEGIIYNYGIRELTGD